MTDKNKELTKDEKKFVVGFLLVAFVLLDGLVLTETWWEYFNAIAGLCLLYLIWEGLNKIGGKLYR